MRVKDEGGLVLFVSGTLIALLLGMFFGIRSGPSRPDDLKRQNQDSRLQLRTFYTNFNRLAEYEPSAGPYLDIVREAVQEHVEIYELDPLLVLALIKKESAFRTKAVSPVGAAGPMQFMPRTGLEMGLKPVYSPDVLDRADRWRNRARTLYSRAARHMKTERFSLLPGIVERWKEANERSERLYERYRRTLKQKISNKSVEEIAGIDQRFMRRKAVMSGVKYLARLFRKRNGDVRESLAAYNAGPGSVRRYNGIPPYNQTVHYQNTIVNTYQDYRQYLNSDREDRGTNPTLSMVE